MSDRSFKPINSQQKEEFRQYKLATDIINGKVPINPNEPVKI